MPSATADPSPCNATQIRRAARQISRFYDSCLNGTGLRVTQYSLLAQLERHGPCTMVQLAELLTMDRATIGHNLRPLEREGLVTIAKSTTDGRARVVQVTPFGTQQIAQARPAWQTAQAEFEARFGGEEAAAMRATMIRVVERTPSVAE